MVFLMAFSDIEEQTPFLCLVLTNLAIKGIRLNSAQLLLVLWITLNVLPELSVLRRERVFISFVTDL